MISKVISFLVLIFALCGNVNAVKYISLGNHFVAANANSEQLSQEIELELSIENTSIRTFPRREHIADIDHIIASHSNYSVDRLTCYFSSRLKS